MPITVDWFNREKTILLEGFDGKWTIDEYYLLIDEAAAMCATQPHEVYVIADFTHSAGLPRGNVMTAIHYADTHLPENQNVAVLIKSGALIEAFLKVARRMNLKALEMVYPADTLDEAVQIIANLQSRKNS